MASAAISGPVSRRVTLESPQIAKSPKMLRVANAGAQVILIRCIRHYRHIFGKA
jgi:hypothetical protein